MSKWSVWIKDQWNRVYCTLFLPNSSSWARAAPATHTHRMSAVPQRATTRSNRFMLPSLVEIAREARRASPAPYYPWTMLEKTPGGSNQAQFPSIKHPGPVKSLTFLPAKRLRQGTMEKSILRPSALTERTCMRSGSPSRYTFPRDRPRSE